MTVWDLFTKSRPEAWTWACPPAALGILVSFFISRFSSWLSSMVGISFKALRSFYKQQFLGLCTSHCFFTNIFLHQNIEDTANSGQEPPRLTASTNTSLSKGMVLWVSVGGAKGLYPLLSTMRPHYNHHHRVDAPGSALGPAVPGVKRSAEWSAEPISATPSFAHSEDTYEGSRGCWTLLKGLMQLVEVSRAQIGVNFDFFSGRS